MTSIRTLLGMTFYVYIIPSAPFPRTMLESIAEMGLDGLSSVPSAVMVLLIYR